MDGSLLGLMEKTRRIGSWWVDTERSVCHWSKVTYEIHDEDPSKDIALADGINYYVPEHRPVIEKCIEDAIAERKTWDVELKIQTTTGRVRWVRAMGEPVFDDDKLVRLQGLFEDIHERKQLELENQQLSQRLRLALDASQIGVWEWDITKDELIWDAQMYSLYGVPEDDFGGAFVAWQKGLHPDDKDRATQEVQAAINEHGRLDTAFRIVWPHSGDVRIIQARGQLVLDEQGQNRKLIGLNWDVTEEQDRQVQLERSNEELAQFAYRASHDLKAPLTTIKGLARYLVADVEAGDFSDVSHNAKTIEKQAASLESLVMSLLEIAKADLEEQKATPIDFEALLGTVTASLDGLSGSRDVAIRSEVLVKTPPVLELGRLHQIVANLVANGIAYSDPEKEERWVKIKVEDRGPRIFLSVCDNGIGIPDKYHGKVFGLFRRFHASDVSGTGVGLYIVQKNLERMGGFIQFESSPRGTCFEIDLPREHS